MKVEFPKVNNKLAFFDFDLTLVAHNHSSEYVNARENYLMDCIYMLTAIEEEHAKDRPLPCMQWYVKKLFDEGYGLYCLTHEIFNLRDQLKKDQLEIFYPDTPMTYLTVDTPEHKIDMIKAIAMTECCDLKDVIFVDDRTATVNLAIMAGIDAKHLSDIVLMYESYIIPQEQDVIFKPVGINQINNEFLNNLKTSDEKMIDTIITEQESELEKIMKLNPSLLKNTSPDTITDIGFSDDELEQVYSDCEKIIKTEGDARL